LASAFPLVSSFDEQFGRFLRAKRGERTLQEFAKEIGLTKSSVHKLENAQVSARLQTIERICKRLKCKIRDIFP
jgi:DNA-binding Xre family transcriptional regulator